MDSHLRPELEQWIREDVQRGAYRTLDEYVEHAVSLLHEQEQWLAENRAEISRKIDEGLASAGRGELSDPEEVRRSMTARKRTWLDDVRRASAVSS